MLLGKKKTTHLDLTREISGELSNCQIKAKGSVTVFLGQTVHVFK